ncbi:transglycosylase SLT domain-containing protein [Desulfovibrio sp. OttesenSCG-928-O18]|nr:transglycosylase SLT domain-containing protein [Desulfovibrio sp. OttesenSCG-928-O18]
MKTTPARIRQLWLPFIAFLAASILFLAFVPVDVPQQEREVWRKGDSLRVGAPEPVRQATVLSPYGPGVEFELVSRFCEDAPCTTEWVNVENKDAGFAMLRRGEIDLLVGFWDDAPRKNTETGTKDAPGIAAGRAYAHFNPVRVSGAAAPRPQTGENAARQAPGSALEALAKTFTAFMPAFLIGEQAALAEEKLPFPVFSLLEGSTDDPGKDILLVDPASYVLWLPFIGEVEMKQVKRQTPYRWFWRNDSSALAAFLAAFWENPTRDAELAELTERYFGFLPRTLRQRDILELSQTLAARLPEYEPFIMKAARETGVPPLLLVAAIYQESRFDPSAVSETNVRGIMQLTTNTARMLDVDRKNPEQCIMGGARYIRDLFDRIGGKAASDWDRWFMALAAYNQGMSNLNRTIRLSQELGGKGDTWTDLKRAFPLSTTCRGVEARSFVEKIRYYHFILHGLVALAPSETQDFAPLLGLALSDDF